jgi:uncharacterized protein with NRDE domain
MCIALLSSAHPAYKLILIDNRDEFVNRPTAVANWWPSPHQNVLGGCDLLREVQGTWLGVTKTGKMAVLTNFREENQKPAGEGVSRGAIIREFLTDVDGAKVGEWVKSVVNTGTARDAGGFSLVCGNVGDALAVISNRAQDGDDVPWVLGSTQTVGLSNASFKDRSWKKVTMGEEGMLEAIRASIDEGESEDALVERFLELLSQDTLPRSGDGEGGGLEAHILDLRNTIFVPPLGRRSMAGLSEDEMRAARKNEGVRVIEPANVRNGVKLGVDGIYATQKQTVVLIDHDDNVRFVERTLFDDKSISIPPGEGDVDIRFKIER